LHNSHQRVIIDVSIFCSRRQKKRPRRWNW